MNIRKRDGVFAMLAVFCAAAAVCFGSAESRAYGAVYGETQILMADFGGTASENVFGISGWNTVIRDVYTRYRDYGPGEPSLPWDPRPATIIRA